MLSTAIVVFREALEASLIVSIVMAACRGLRGRNRWVAIGIAGGLAGASLVAAFAGAISEAASGMGQELLNAAVLGLAVIMLGWHNVWMSSHAKEMASQVNEVGKAVAAGTRPLYAVALVIGIAILREGSETVLFVYSIAASSGEAAPRMLTGGILGVIGGIFVGITLYFGLLSIPMRNLFTVTNWMILFLAAGLAAQAAGFLVQADILPALGNAVWDTSALLSETSILGRILHTLIGYIAAPAGIQILFYLTTLTIIGVLMRIHAPARR